MQTIEREELKAALDAGEPLRLVMALHEQAFEAARIPGSVRVLNLEDAQAQLDTADDIVVYCSHRACFASTMVATKLEEAGYQRVRHYPGGLADWAEAGYPLEGSSAG